ncbi:hypothetical protein P3X46_024845 [Hevea brasiliensis]|uniref:F-box domain-containing protein n=1 Tax=Hevea brasiliensis TaxID=3981 RepID=A0ABQ9L5I4_HEVBR|nr:putative F-box/FBD/LRR-repeat protein At3g59240 [Hevea brasiliensis]KAJ9159335.1 hypothetical protein P3X46_024845 [Hevea brasiliensis]
MEPKRHRHQCILDDLPDHIVLNILNFFTMEDIARCSTLSQRFRRLCTSVPSLHVSRTAIETNLLKRAKFVDFIDRFMIHRRLKLVSFRLSWSIPVLDWVLSEEYRIESWLHQAARCGVEKLNLRIFYPEGNVSSFALPVSFSSCSFLRILLLELKNGILKLPTTGFSSLKILNLSLVRIEHEDQFEECLSSCKCLQKLNLRNLDGIKSINITSTSIANLTIIQRHDTSVSAINVSACNLQYIQIYWSSSQSKQVKITAPSLLGLMMEGVVFDSYHLGSFNSLEHAIIFFLTNPRLLSKNKASIDSSYLNEILFSVRHARVLFIGIAFLKLLLTEELLLHFSYMVKVQRLHLHVTPHSEDYFFPMVVSILNRLPSLESLTMKSFFESAAPSGNASSFSMESYESKSVDFVDKLKSVLIELYRGHKALEFIKHLLNQKKALVKMTIYYSPEEHPQPSNITRAIHAFQNVSSTASVYLLPRAAQLSSDKICWASLKEWSRK